eukprot:356398-Chlamydomonas_euryale.AAC.1
MYQAREKYSAGRSARPGRCSENRFQLRKGCSAKRLALLQKSRDINIARGSSAQRDSGRAVSHCPKRQWAGHESMPKETVGGP